MNWGIGQGYIGLQQSVNRRDQAQNDIANLEAMNEQMRQDRLDQEQAQLKEQAYYEEIRKEAELLLAPDREKINKKAKILGAQVREQIKTYGGSLDKFFANGGHKALNSYKNGVINSEEALLYKDNKKNMETLLDIQRKGNGHLINPNDFRSMKKYQETGEGAITYTGMLSDIELPDADNYDINQDIPARDILYYGENNSNYLKILGNYQLSFPDNQTPTEQDLLLYIEKQYKLKGSNYKRQLEIENAKTRRIQAIQSGRNKSGSSNATDPETGPGSKGYMDSNGSRLSELLTNAEKNITASEFKEGYWENLGYDGLLKDITKGDFTSPAEDYTDNGDGENWFTGMDMMVPGYKPRNAKILNLPKENDELSKKIIPAGFEVENGVIKDFEVSTSMQIFDPSGKPVSAWDDASIFGNSQDYIDNEGPKDFKIVDYITAATIKKDGKDFMIMDPVKFNSDGETDPELLEKYNAKLGESGIDHKAAMVIESEDGHRFYVPFDPTQSKFQADLALADKSDDLTKVSKNNYQRKEESNYARQKVMVTMEEQKAFWDSINVDEKIARNIYSESEMYGPVGAPERRSNLIKSFYGIFTSNALAAYNSDPNQENDLGPNEIYTQASQEQIFAKAINDLVKEGYTNIVEDLENPSIGENEIINKMIEVNPDQEQFYRLWIENYQYLNSK